MSPIALLSVSNKEGLIPLAQALTSLYGFELISSGGTANTLAKANIPVTRVSDYTGAPEILGGRVKTLHPRIHGGILAKRGDSIHESDLSKQNIKQIDLVVVNLYPFQQTVSNPEVTMEKAIENIDIGGPAMVRAAAKNHESVTILTDPSQYEIFIERLKNNKISPEFKSELALKAFEHTASYDIAISEWLQKRIDSSFSPLFNALPIKQKLRYGENPHQNASWYSKAEEGWGGAHQLQGKELSTNNLLDLEAAIATIREFGYGKNQESNSHKKAAVIIKHTNPCGVGIDHNLSSAFSNALAGDPVSAFGGIVALNSLVDEDTANKLTNLFLECVVAPCYEDKAKEILSKKKNLRVIEINESTIDCSEKNYIRSILGGVILQEIDDKKINLEEWETVTKKEVSTKEYEDLEFAWKVVRHVRSNAIVIASHGQTLGIGAGQMNRVGAAKIALDAAGENAKGAVLASDGFLPFDDTVHLASRYGIKSIIQPGGSIKDKESIEACNRLNMSMVLTKRRHFLH
ncbi:MULTISPECIES: bifunctional phosphoribosylaminoimidazolecarboxamide formyltransferase/IMP cyclohydrolase [Prochlorococcus]|uniref:bifunctional phosphoribosylaminoimidazolecarboxamide formyltransferase/IMP cyclohydrolase n=1 Tax=Prochlorococcus TaxID=1218 RepID=UPI000533B480|nr:MULTISPECIES: bifunctional phosphoribosylaminoimidazolecarboxamide formyltransferase/IMP cyclohydrolase [Prochlorococcus]KGG13097.1 IMP cyclohydrolase [Prochlorococcus sp. MIT 0601]